MREYLIKFATPAAQDYKGWERESLPIGNSYMGMCVFGGTQKERLQINEKTLWSGGPSPKRPDYNGGNIVNTHKVLDEFREALSSGKKINLKDYTSKLVGYEEGYGNYLNFGDIELEFNHKQITQYERGLNLNDATAYVTYVCESGKIERLHFAPFIDRTLVSKITTNKKNALEFKISIKPDHSSELEVIDNAIIVKGELEDNGLNFYGRLEILTDGKVEKEEKSLKIINANEAVLIFSLATDYENKYPAYRGKDPKPLIERTLAASLKKGYDSILEQHKEDFKSIFGRMDINLGFDGNVSDFTDKLLNDYKMEINAKNNRYVEELLFMYGRYLLISSSRGNTLPANLQGVWNASNNPPWGSDYHLNINMQMCYWPAYIANMAECALPMIDYIYSLREPGRVTAKEYHGIVSDENSPKNGWVCHTQNTPFGWTCPGWNFHWGWSPAASSWMLQNCYEYFAYTGDLKLLKEKIYPAMKENAKFWLQNLIYLEAEDCYLSAPTYSPEHGPISIGNTYEQELIWQLFDDFGKAAKALGDKTAIVKEVAQVKEKLKPLSVGRWGQIKEWREEDGWYRFKAFRKVAYKRHACQQKHRHISHLLGLYPGSHITRKTPEFMEAAEVSLLDRGFAGTGWSKANKINLWARMKNGKNAYTMLNQLINKSIMKNLWDTHPPYQIDGNFGLTSGMCEMMLYSNEDYIEFLPAIPEIWKNGYIKGLCAKGGFEVDFKWEFGKIKSLKIKHKTKTNAKLYINNAISSLFSDCKEEFITIECNKIIK